MALMNLPGGGFNSDSGSLTETIFGIAGERAGDEIMASYLARPLHQRQGLRERSGNRL